MKVEKIVLDPEEVRALKMCRKKKRLTCRDIDWFVLMSMVHKSVLDKVVPQQSRDSQGWAHFQLSKRGRRYLDVKYKREQEARGR